MPRSLKEIIDKTRGDIPRSRYISKILEQLYTKEKEENGNHSIQNQQSKSRDKPRQDPADSSDFPFTDTSCR
jgi:hypothetical protein